MLEINPEEKPHNNQNAYYILMCFYKISHFLYIKLTKYSTDIPVCLPIWYLLFIIY